MTDDAEIIIVAAGTNDWNYAWTPLGRHGKQNELLHSMVLCTIYASGLLNKYIGKTIIFMTPIKRKNTIDVGDTDALVTNSLGKTLKDYST